MKTVTREQWTTALRSGDFKQAQGLLYDGKDGYCCLGVLGKLTGAKTSPEHAGMVFSGEDAARCSFIPESVSQMVGLDFTNASNLMDMNDRGKSFAKIAEYIDTLPFKDPADG